MLAVLCIAVLLLALVAVLLQNYPWFGIPVTGGRHPDFVARAVVIVLVVLALLMSVGKVAQELL